MRVPAVWGLGCGQNGALGTDPCSESVLPKGLVVGEVLDAPGDQLPPVGQGP